MKSYRVVLFDLFNTVALWSPERMPRYIIDGESRPSTLGVLEDVLAESAPALPFDRFREALAETSAALARERRRDGRERPSRERFSRALASAGHADEHARPGLAERLSLTHMAILADASAVPPAHVDFLERLGRRYPLALVSNFDHAPTARRIIERDGVGGLFRHVVISDEHGWRKPHPRIFDDTLSLLGATPGEALFVGDSPEDDVAGAAAQGIDVAWVNPRQRELPPTSPPPTLEVGRITELEDTLL